MPLSKNFRYHLLVPVIVPALAALVYLVLLAQPTYETEARLIVRENQGGAGPAIPGFAAAFLGVGGRTSLEDALILEDYLHSAAFIELAAKTFDLREHFREAPRDPFRRLPAATEAETFHKFVRKMISIRVRAESGVLTVQVRTFSPDLARDLAQFIIERSEEMINDLNERVVRSQTNLAQTELNKSMERLKKTRKSLLDFQVAHSMVDPVSETTASFSNIAALDSRLVEKRTELRAKTHYLREDAFELRRLRQEIKALEEQREEETSHLVADGGSSMVRTLQDYENLKIEHEFALAAYTTAMTMAEKATIEASRQEKFLLVIAPPHTPEKPVFPRPVRGTITVLVLSFLGYGILRLGLATIRDHTI